MIKNIQVKIVNTSSEFILLEQKWKELEKSIKHSNLTSSFDWLYTWWETFKDVNNNAIGYDKKLVIICLYESGDLISIAPFLKVYRKKYGFSFSFLEFLGQQWAGNYLDIITDNPNQNREIFNWLYKNLKFDILMLKYIPQHSENFNPKDMYLYSACPEIPVNEYTNHDEYISKKYSKSLKQNLRTANNRAKKSGVVMRTSVEELNEENFNETVQISDFKLLDNKSSIFRDENKRLFMKNITKRMASNVVFVNLDGKNVAYRTNVFFNNNKYCLDASYDRNYRKFELGSISVDANLLDSFSNNIAHHCLGPGLDLYKSKFTKENIKIFIFLKRGNTFISYFLIKPLKKLIQNKEKDANQLLGLK
jgi:hypothetical protein